MPDGRCERVSTMATKCKRKVLYFKDDIVIGRRCVPVGLSACRGLPMLYSRTGNN